MVFINTNQTIAAVLILDLTGKLAYSQQNNVSEIDLSTLNNGIYFVIVQSENGAISKSKMVINK